jgi:hypothetical protein
MQGIEVTVLRFVNFIHLYKELLSRYLFVLILIRIES